MRTSLMQVFDDFVPGTNPVYTSEEWNDALGQPNKLAIQAVADQVTGTASLTVAIEHSCDQRNWLQKPGTAPINSESIPAAATTPVFGSDAGTVQNLGYVRLKISLTGTTPAAHVRIHVCGRDDA